MSDSFDDILSILGNDYAEETIDKTSSNKIDNTSKEGSIRPSPIFNNSPEIETNTTYNKTNPPLSLDQDFSKDLLNINSDIKATDKDDYNINKFNSNNDSFAVIDKNIETSSSSDDIFDNLLGEEFVSSDSSKSTEDKKDDYDLENFNSINEDFNLIKNNKEQKPKEKSEYDDIFSDFYEVE